ncbi:MAG: hypothetical protein IKV59_00605 [Lachnospiraceae bacterium]|nr:hypothetical protein [Lachnospiraceae bacterium]
MEKNNNVPVPRTHRVGSITAGFGMLVFGIMLLLHSLFGMMSYQLIFSLWPLLLIGLGLELLLSNFFEKRIVYDRAAVVLMMLMVFFAMGLAVVDVGLQMSAEYVMGRF